MSLETIEKPSDEHVVIVVPPPARPITQRLAPVLALIALSFLSSAGCAALVGGAAGGAAGYVAGHEAGEDEAREEIAADRAADHDND